MIDQISIIIIVVICLFLVILYVTKLKSYAKTRESFAFHNSALDEQVFDELCPRPGEGPWGGYEAIYCRGGNNIEYQEDPFILSNKFPAKWKTLM